MGQEESTMIDEDAPTRVLESRTIESVAKFIREGRARKIVVMTGAGISTSAGIPDFRSPGTGLYANLARLNLPHPEAVFEIDFFRRNPFPFYTLAHELYPGRYEPTITHSFINLLHTKGLLLKAFTQNIDCLEREAGLPGDMIIEAHGSFAEQSCIDCKSPYPADLMRKAVEEMTVPHCVDNNCNGLVKPQIVFFGEQLPAAFFLNRQLPQEADLCIVMGTSLSVQPFASLPQICSEGTPRILINQEQVGAMGSRSDDVLILGDCDNGVRKLAEACGWLEELEEAWAKVAPRKSKEAKKTETREFNSPDEELENEINRMTLDVEKNLQLSRAQHDWLANHIDRKIAQKMDDQDEEEVEQARQANEGNAERQQEWQGNHVEAKAARTQESDESDPSPQAAAQRLETQTMPTAKSVANGNTIGGLSHVFPHLEKKSSL